MSWLRMKEHVLVVRLCCPPSRDTVGVEDLTDDVAEAFRMLDIDGDGFIAEEALEELGRRLAAQCNSSSKEEGKGGVNAHRGAAQVGAY